MIAFDTAAYGAVRTASSDELRHLTSDGWRVLGAVPTTEFFNEEVSYYDEDDGRHKNQRHLGHFMTTRFVLGLAKDDVVRQKTEELKHLRDQLRSVTSERDNLITKEAENRAEVKQLNKEAERLTETINRLSAEKADVEIERDEARFTTTELENTLRGIFQDDDVNDAVLAAVSASEPATAKQMIADYMRLRETLKATENK